MRWHSTGNACRPTATATASIDHHLCPGMTHAIENPRRPSHTPHRLGGIALSWAVVGLGLWAPMSPAIGQTTTAPLQKSIYTCIDAKGNRLTADRPIAECMDREQRELSPSGTLKRVIPPSLTAEERSQAEARSKAELEKQAQANEERRKERLLLIRFPDQASHQKAREEALNQVREVIAAVRKRQTELDKQRQEIDAEFEFYQRDPSKAPEWLKRRREDNAQQRSSQSMFLNDQERELQRINQRFDQELTLLRQLWNRNGR